VSSLISRFVADIVEDDGGDEGSVFSSGFLARVFHLVIAAEILLRAAVFLHQTQEHGGLGLRIDMDASLPDELLEFGIGEIFRGVGKTLRPDREAEKAHRDREENQSLPVEPVSPPSGAAVLVFRFVVLHRA
jgi:hypothetical protein